MKARARLSVTLYVYCLFCYGLIPLCILENIFQLSIFHTKHFEVTGLLCVISHIYNT